MPRNIGILSIFLPIIINFSVFLFLPNQKQTQLRHEVVVTLKLVQVYVTDRKGNPIFGLKKDDFLIFDEGQNKSISAFEEHAIFPQPKKEKRQLWNLQEPGLSVPGLMPRKFFLFFDFAYNNAIGIEKARKAALYFVDTQVQPQDEVGVLSYSAMKGLKLHEYLTTDHQKVRQTIAEFRMDRIIGRAEDFEVEYWQAMTGQNPLDASRPGGVEDRVEPSVLRRRREESKNQAYHFAHKMVELAQALRYIPGHKNIVLFSSGVPYSIVYGIQVAYGYPDFSDMGNPVLRFKYEDMLKELSAANCSIYPLDTQELTGIIDRDTSMRGSYILQKMASATGGKYFGNINNYEEHIEKIQAMTGCYYVLGYYVDEQWDGKYHQIKVEVNRPGLRVYAQKGYFNPKPFTQYSDLERMLHLVDLALSENPLFQTPLRFPMLSLPSFSRGKPSLSLWVKVEKEKIQALSGKKTEAVTLLFDREENIARMERQEVDLTRWPEGNLFFTSSVALEPGEYKCRLVLRNLETGRGAVASCSVTVPQVQAERIRLSFPLLLKEEKDSLYVQVSRSPADFPFDRTKYAPLLEALDCGRDTLFVSVRCMTAGIPRPEIRLLANVLQYQGEATTAIPAGISILERKEEADGEVFFLKIQTEELPPGEYVLYLFAEELTTGTKSQTNTSFRIE